MISNSAYIVTSPDDKIIDGVKILCIDLTIEQSQFVSNSITKVDHNTDLVIYVWRSGDPVTWALDKKYKSDLIIFNAESLHQTLIGYLAAHKNSVYFGHLKDLFEVNSRAIYSVDYFHKLMEGILNKDEKLC